MAYTYYKTANLNDFFFSYAIRLINGTGLLIYYRSTRIISISKSQVPRHLGNSA